MLCRPRLHNVSPPQACVWLRWEPACAVARPLTALEKISRGGPQLIGSWLLPPMPASPETFARSEKYGVTSLVSRVN